MPLASSVFLLFCGSVFAQQVSQPSLTIYNQNFAVVRQEIPLDLKSGVNQFNDERHHHAPRAGFGHPARSQRQALLASAGAELPRRSSLADVACSPSTKARPSISSGRSSIIKGKVIRSGYVPHDYFAMNRYGQSYYQQQMAVGAEAADHRGGRPVALRACPGPALPRPDRRQPSSSRGWTG